MTEAEIAQALQARLVAPVKVAVKRRQGHLYVLLSRPSQAQLDYPRLTDQVQAELQALALSGLEQVTVYGRESGHSEYEWQKTDSLPDPLLTMTETTIALGEKNDSLLQDLTVVAPAPANPRRQPLPDPPDKGDGGSRMSWVWLGGALLVVGIGLVFVILAFS